jgi:serine protease
MSASCTITSANSSQNTAEEDKKIIKKDDKYKKGELLVKFKEGVSEEEISAINKEKGTEVLEFIKGIKVYRLKIISNKSVENMVEAYSKDLRIEYAEPNYIQRTMERSVK